MSDAINLQQLKRTLKNGSLVLANKSIKAVPDVVWKIYDLDFDDVPFNEKKRIVDVNLANNELVAVDDRLVDTFPDLRKLNLTENAITTLPAGLFTLKELTSLRVGNNKLSSVPADIASLANLRLLHLPYNAFTAFPDAVGSLTKLTELDVSHNALTTLPVLSMPLLATLNASHNKLQTLPEGVFKSLEVLTSLDLGQNRLSEVHANAGLGECKALKELVLENNKLTKFDGDFSDSAVTLLRLNANQLSAIPPCVMQMKGLITLILSNNKIEEVPESIAELPKLRDLVLQTNNIRRLPTVLGTMRSLKQLMVRGNLIKTIRQSLVDEGDRILLDYLKEKHLEASGAPAAAAGSNSEAKYKPDQAGGLDLTKGGLTTLAVSDIGRVEKLSRLVLSKNPLGSLPDLSGLDALRVLVVESAKLKSLHASVAALPKLEELNVSGNALGGVPELKECPKLERLNVGYNRGLVVGVLPPTLNDLDLTNIGMAEVPKELLELHALSTLRLARNPIKELPSSGLEEAWPKLKCLDIGYTEVRRLPSELGLLKKLNTLVLDNLQLVVPSQAVVRKGTSAILDFLREKS